MAMRYVLTVPAWAQAGFGDLSRAWAIFSVGVASRWGHRGPARPPTDQQRHVGAVPGLRLDAA